MKKFILVILLALSGCALGADYTPPHVDVPTTWIEAPLVPFAVNRTTAMTIDKLWWKNFDDASLNLLITKALAQNLDIKIALARIREARAARLGTIAEQLPEIDATANAKSSKNSLNALNTAATKPYHAFSLGFDASWEADIFGGRRAIEAADATFEAAEESAHDVEVTLMGDVASQYIAMRNYQRQIQVAEENLNAQRDTLTLTQSRQQSGLVSHIDVSQAEALLTTTQATIPTLRTAMRQSLHALEILLGEQPGALEHLLTKHDSIPTSSHDVAIAAPADALRNRPDIRQAERELAAATAIQGVALSGMYPQISLSALLGLTSKQPSNLITGNSKNWSLEAGALLPLLDFGRIRATIDRANAKQEQAWLIYQKTVLNALKEVENTLVAYLQEKQRLVWITQSFAAQRSATELIDQRYRNGLVSFLEVLNAKRSLYTAELAEAQSRATLSTNLIALYKALGGGWQTAEK